jgi:ABC-type transport system substrate-binding protein
VTFANAPVVGSGPFTSSAKNNVAIFKRNDSYWALSRGSTSSAAVVFDDDAMVTALKAGDLTRSNAPATAMKTLGNAGFDVSNVPGLDRPTSSSTRTRNKKEHRETLT